MTDTLPPKPQTYNGDLTKLPLALEHLREQQVWLCWSWFWNGKKWTKPPYRADNPERNASSSDPATWGTYEQAIEQVHAGRADGIGVALKGRNLGGVDLDHCRDPETGNIDSQAEERLRQRAAHAMGLVQPQPRRKRKAHHHRDGVSLRDQVRLEGRRHIRRPIRWRRSNL